MSTIDVNRWRTLNGWLDHALVLEPEARSHWLAAFDNTDPELARELRALLDEHELLRAEGFLEGAAAPIDRPTLAGQSVGAYRLISLLGQGGMGSVWHARRSDGRFEGDVAIKLLNIALIGEEGMERFRREGSLLARLTHPNIGRLLDAGIASGGQPFLVLELIDGQPVDEYCRQHDLGVGDRLRLFGGVIAAVAHAHRNLVVHRDLKPSNVFVSRDGQVKLLDFGVGKLLVAEGDGPALTKAADHPMTPRYAAPEQVLGAAITTATDVYALGLLLSELLTGRGPGTDATQSPATLLKSILEDEPAQLPASIPGYLRDDLATIIATAVKKNPDERYPSASALGEDLKRCLNHEPISARPDTMVYRTRKLLRRHRLPAALALLAVVALLIGIVGTATQAARATRQATIASEARLRADAERDFARQQLARAESINDLNELLLSEVAPLGAPFTVGDLLKRAEAILSERTSHPDALDVELLISIGSQYRKMDEYDSALRSMNRATQIASTLGDRVIRGKANCALASVLGYTAEKDRAQTLQNDALDDIPSDASHVPDRVSCLMTASHIAEQRDDYTEAVDFARAAVKALERLPVQLPLLEYQVTARLAEALRMAGQGLAAARVFAEADRQLTALGRGQTQSAGTLLNNWALALEQLGQPLEAERLYRRAIVISSTDGTLESVSPMLLNNLGRTLRDLDRLDEARTLVDRAIKGARSMGAEHILGQALLVRADIHRLAGELNQADDVLRNLAAQWGRSMPPGSIPFSSLAREQAAVAEGRGDLKAALELIELAARIAAASPARNDYLPRILLRKSAIELALSDPVAAQRDARAALATFRSAVDPETPSSNVGKAYLLLGKALRADGDQDAAKSAFKSAREQLAAALGRGHALTLEADETLIMSDRDAT
jgi:eukaryotic-like serine/threonine-protein kinase